jgi:hypothetical protein
MFKDWLREIFNVNSSDAWSFGHNKVNNWIDRLYISQSNSSLNADNN